MTSLEGAEKRGYGVLPEARKVMIATRALRRSKLPGDGYLGSSQMFGDRCLVIGITGKPTSIRAPGSSPFSIPAVLWPSWAYFKAIPMRFNVFNIDIDLSLFRQGYGGDNPRRLHDGGLNDRSMFPSHCTETPGA
ncbi:hypothetical protein [Mesorhizobium sp. M2A.F.Ca.ET.037.01.1.1]|uniref:hypothetical protein n=1 Tax=Mesorhizobium sp. TaxID=1871066 RepID=UPI0011AEBCB6